MRNVRWNIVGILGRLQVRSQEKGWKVGIEDAEMMNAGVACREKDGENDEKRNQMRGEMPMPSERAGSGEGSRT